MLPKPNTDKISCSNYRPISLLNLNIKSLAKILTTHLNPIICSLIHKDQIEFTPLCQVSAITCQATVLIEMLQRRCVPEYLLSLDIRP